MYVQLVALKGPGRVPLPATLLFGRDSVLLTFHGNTHCAWYAPACLAHALALLRRSTRPPPPRASPLAAALERLTHRYVAAVFALGMYVGGGYYGLLHFLPVTRLRARMIEDYDGKMALLHLGPMLFVLGDTLLKDLDLVRKHALRPAGASRAIMGYGGAYFAWSAFCVWMNGGTWPYPFQPALSPVQHLIFVGSSLLTGSYLAKFSHRILCGVDRRRRRRIRTLIRAGRIQGM